MGTMPSTQEPVGDMAHSNHNACLLIGAVGVGSSRMDLVPLRPGSSGSGGQYALFCPCQGFGIRYCLLCSQLGFVSGCCDVERDIFFLLRSGYQV